MMGDDKQSNLRSECSVDMNRPPITAILSTAFMEIDDDDHGRNSGRKNSAPRYRTVKSPVKILDPLKGTNGIVGMQKSAVEAHRLVAFSEDVSVIFIPRRCDYPEDLRSLIFPNKKELSRNVARNMREFASDGYDWRKVKEDHDMYITADGERIHPIHLADIMSKRSIPLPSVQNLARPKPRRPIHPKMRRGCNHKIPENAVDDPVARPPTPFPYLKGGIIG